jgi:phosphopantothenate-cysteine ligase
MVILAAAVSDYGCVPAEKKIRSKEDLTIQLHALPKLISKIREWSPKTFLVGFKLLVSPADGDVIEEAKKSLVANNCDMVVANYLTDIKQGKHIVHLVDKRETISCIPDKTQNDNYCAMNVIERALLLKK